MKFQDLFPPLKYLHFLADKGFSPCPLADMSGENVSFFLRRPLVVFFAILWRPRIKVTQQITFHNQPSSLKLTSRSLVGSPPDTKFRKYIVNF